MELNDIISSGLLELYIAGLTSPEESLQVEGWAKEYPEVKRELGSIEAAVESYAFSESITPGVDVKDKVMKAIEMQETNTIKAAPASFRNEMKERTKVYSLPPFYKWAVAAGLILLLGSLAFNYMYFNKYRSASTDLQVAQNQLQSQKQMTDTMSNEMNVVTDKYTLPVVLNGTPHAPDAVAKIFWVKNSGEVYVDPTNLPQVPEGKQYQLWAIVDGKPVDAGMISTKKGVYHIQKMKSFGKADAFAITLEKTGGSPTPTMSEMYVMAKI
ncbi:MAG: anti-sigma factor [Chitinophagaceae bacterium]|nr:anti-sigma factor [Chitinophagaceae bacterium]